MARHVKVRLPNAAERRQLRETLEESTDTRLCRWAEPLLFYGAGLNVQCIADALAVHVNTIWACLHRFARLGMTLFQCVAPQGDPPGTTATQIDEIARVAEQSPTELGLPYGRWSLAKLQEHLIHQRRLLKTISREHLQRLLKKKQIHLRHVQRKLVSYDPRRRSVRRSRGAIRPRAHASAVAQSRPFAVAMSASLPAGSASVHHAGANSSRTIRPPAASAAAMRA